MWAQTPPGPAVAGGRARDARRTAATSMRSSLVHHQPGPMQPLGMARRLLSGPRPLAALPAPERERESQQAPPAPAPPTSSSGASGDRGPKLPPRIPTARATSSRKGGNGSGGGSGPGGGGGPGRWRTYAAMAGSIGVYTGLVGTAAVVLAAAADIDLISSFRWSWSDLALGLSLIAPLQLLNLAILAPSYSDWSLPGIEGLQSQLEGEATKAKGDAPPASASSATAQPGSEAGASSAVSNTDAAGSSTSTAPGASQPPQPAAPAASSAEARDATATASTSAPAAPAPAARPDAGAGSPPLLSPPLAPPLSPPLAPPSAGGPAPAGGSASKKRTTTTTTPAPSLDGLIPASAWGRRPEPIRLGRPSWAVLRDAMHLAQGHYVSNNPTARLGPSTEAGVLLLDCLAGEMLYRGVGLTLTARWLCDRLYEAGADDIISLGAGPLALTTTPDELSRWAAAGGVLLFVVFAVVRKVSRTLSRTTLVLELAEVQAAQAKAASSSSASSAAASSAPGSSPPGGEQQGGASPAPPLSPQAAVSAAAAAAAAAAGRASGGPGGGAKLRRVQSVPPGTFDALIYAAVIQGVRDASQTLALNAAFILTGNLAASYAASVANQLALSALQRLALERMRRRSRDLARELRAYQDRIRSVSERARERAAEKVAAAQAAAAEAAATAAVAAAAEALAADAAAAAAAAADAAASPASEAPGGGDAAAAPQSSPRAPLTKAQRALAMLDVLVPEPPKPPKGAGAGGLAPSRPLPQPTPAPTSPAPPADGGSV